MNDVKACIVVTAPVAAVLRKALEMMGDGPDNFISGVCPEGSKPGTAATHYISEGYFPQWLIDVIQDGDAFDAKLREKAADRKIAVPWTKTQVKAAVSKSAISFGTFTDAEGIVSDEDALSVLRRLKLQLCEVVEDASVKDGK